MIATQHHGSKTALGGHHNHQQANENTLSYLLAILPPPGKLPKSLAKRFRDEPDGKKRSPSVSSISSGKEKLSSKKHGGDGGDDDLENFGDSDDKQGPNQDVEHDNNKKKKTDSDNVNEFDGDEDEDEDDDDNDDDEDDYDGEDEFFSASQGGAADIAGMLKAEKAKVTARLKHISFDKCPIFNELDFQTAEDTIEANESRIMEIQKQQEDQLKRVFLTKEQDIAIVRGVEEFGSNDWPMVLQKFKCLQLVPDGCKTIRKRYQMMMENLHPQEELVVNESFDENNFFISTRLDSLPAVLEKANVDSDYCVICVKPGTLICCDECQRAYHRKCVDPKRKRKRDSKKNKNKNKFENETSAKNGRGKDKKKDSENHVINLIDDDDETEDEKEFPEEMQHLLDKRGLGVEENEEASDVHQDEEDEEEHWSCPHCQDNCLDIIDDSELEMKDVHEYANMFGRLIDERKRGSKLKPDQVRSELAEQKEGQTSKKLIELIQKEDKEFERITKELDTKKKFTTRPLADREKEIVTKFIREEESREIIKNASQNPEENKTPSEAEIDSDISDLEDGNDEEDHESEDSDVILIEQDDVDALYSRIKEMKKIKSKTPEPILSVPRSKSSISTQSTVGNSHKPNVLVPRSKASTSNKSAFSNPNILKPRPKSNTSSSSSSSSSVSTSLELSSVKRLRDDQTESLTFHSKSSSFKKFKK